MRFILIILLACSFQVFSFQAFAQNKIANRISVIGESITQDLSVFTGGVNRWMSGQMSDAASTKLVKDSLIPVSHRLFLNYTNTMNLAKKIPHEYGASQVSAISTDGAALFKEWYNLLKKMVVLDSQKKQKELEAFAGKYLQAAIVKTTNFIQQSAILSQQLQQSANTSSNQNNYNTYGGATQGQATDNSEYIRIMREMQQSTHETNQVILDAMGPTPVDIYDAEGNFLYTE